MRSLGSRLSLLLLCAALPLGCGDRPAASGEPAAVASATAPPAVVSLKQLSREFASLARRITPSVVHVAAVRRAEPPTNRSEAPAPFDPAAPFKEDLMPRPHMGEKGFDLRGMGSGVIVDGEGHILTNYHVVFEADELSIRLSDRRVFRAQVIGKDARSDLALIKIEADSLVPAKLGVSATLEIGEWVVAAGNPFGLDQSISSGIVSAKGRALSGHAKIGEFIQTDAAINPGNSGGPLLNLEGEVIGINTAIFSRSGGYMGIGFAIPIDLAKGVMAELKRAGRVQRASLGAALRDGSPPGSGALVESVTPGSSAASLIEKGDLIVELNGRKVEDAMQVAAIVGLLAPGKKIDIVISRAGNPVRGTVELGEERAEAASSEGDPGVAPTPAEPQFDAQGALGLVLGEGSGGAVIVESVSESGLAALAGISSGDKIVAADGQAISGLAAIGESLTKERLAKGIRLRIAGKGGEREAVLRVRS